MVVDNSSLLIWRGTQIDRLEADNVALRARIERLEGGHRRSGQLSQPGFNFGTATITGWSRHDGYWERVLTACTRIRSQAFPLSALGPLSHCLLPD